MIFKIISLRVLFFFGSFYKYSVLAKFIDVYSSPRYAQLEKTIENLRTRPQ